ncbi:MAG: MarR family transcriptional regulator [Candidatus Hydrogenedentes bacterium]|nr:MarR family transcriptional regulator [Candidatus Hydrogenedentota bacterium]
MKLPLREHIKQSKPFPSLEAEAYLNLIVLAQELNTPVRRVLKRSGLSLPQYNALRILRGSHPEGLSCKEIGKRMVHHVPDVTRLLDRLEAQGLVRRERENEDRRVVRVCITEQGLDRIAPIDQPLAEVHKETLGHLGEEQLRKFIGLMESARLGL